MDERSSALMSRLRLFLGRLVRRMAKRIEQRRIRRAPLRTVLDIPVVVIDCYVEVAPEHYFQRIEAALRLIGTYHPLRLRQIQRDIRVIWVRAMAHRAEYRAHVGACVLEPRFVGSGEFSPAQIAASIVHEATHARIHNAGIAPSAADSTREELICNKAERYFGRRLPDGAAVVARADARILAFETGMGRALSPAESYEAALRSRLARLEVYGVPRGLRRALERFAYKRWGIPHPDTSAERKVAKMHE